MRSVSAVTKQISNANHTLSRSVIPTPPSRQMCGIVGIFGKRDDTIMKNMLEVTKHRGEDDTKFEYYDNLCGIGINRLSIMDLEHGMQPLHNSSKDLHVVFNGMIYNTEGIQSDLKGHKKLNTRNDGEVISHLYEDYGLDAPKFLDGMWAFILYDSKKKTFLAARDPVGIKPFYYLQQDGKWYFSSEMKAFLKVPGAVLENVKLLKPGHRLTPERGEERFHQWSKVRSVPSPSMVYQLMDHAVKKRMLADVPVGTFLSGGIDSSIVTMLASKYNPKVHAFTVGMEGSPDLIAAKKVAKHLDIPHHIRDFSVDEMLENLPEVIYHAECYNPSNITGSIVTRYGAEFAKSMGMKVVLCGEGGDEVFGGYKALRNLSPKDLYDSSWTLVDNIGNTECKRLDRMSMSVSLEARVPFLDMKVIEYGTNLPQSAKIHVEGDKKIEKYILRQAFTGTLPDEILWREKMPFDQGSGGRGLLSVVNSKISDKELKELQHEFPHAGIANKEIAYYFKIFHGFFGNMGGKDIFPLFGDYPVMMDGIISRTEKSGS